MIQCTIGSTNILLFNSTPIISWDSVPGATYYLVSIMQGSVTLWHEEVNCTEVLYSGEPSLNLGLLYEVTIKANNSLNISETKKFMVIDEKNIEYIQEAERELNRLESLNEDTSVARALLYSQVYKATALRLINNRQANIAAAVSTNNEFCDYMCANYPSWCCSSQQCRNHPRCRDSQP